MDKGKIVYLARIKLHLKLQGIFKVVNRTNRICDKCKNQTCTHHNQVYREEK